MANVGTVTFDIAAESAKLRSELDKVKKEVGGLSTSAKNFEKGLKTIGGVLAGVFSIGAVSAFASKINQAGDRLDDLSQKMGVSASRLNVIELAATQAGASTEAVSTAMAKLTENVGSAAMGNKAAAAAISTLGLSTAELLKLRPDQTFEAVTQALSRMPNEYQRVSVAQDLFGKGAKELAGLYREGTSAIEEMDRVLERHGAKLSDLDVAKIGVMNNDLETQGEIIKNLGMKFLANFSPAVSVATEIVSDMIIKLGGVEKAGKDVGIVFVRVVNSIVIAAGLIASTFEAARSAAASVLTVGLTGIEKYLEANLALTRAFGLDTYAERTATALEFVSGIAESVKSTALSAASNAQSSMVLVIEATADFINAAEIFDAKAKAMDARAKAAAKRAPGGGAVTPGAGESAASRILTDTPLSAAGAGGNVRVEGPDEFRFDQMTREIYASNLEALKEAGVLRQQEWENQLNAMGMSLGNSITYQTALEAAKYETWGGLAGEFVSVIGNSNKRMAKLQQGLALAQAIWWTASGVTNALRSVPFPANIAAAAKVGIMGALQIAKIKSAKYSAGGSFAGGGGLSGGGESGGGEGSFATPAGVTQQEPQRMAQVIIQGDVFASSETVSYLIDKIREAVNDRDVSFIDINSRQALDLRGG